MSLRPVRMRQGGFGKLMNIYTLFYIQLQVGRLALTWRFRYLGSDVARCGAAAQPAAANRTWLLHLTQFIQQVYTRPLYN